MTLAARRDLLGAIHSRGETSFRIWAPQAATVEVVMDDSAVAPLRLQRESNGYFGATSAALPPGTLYKYRVDGAEPWPDPCSRFQPRGPHGPSMIVDVDAFEWSDSHWPGIELRGQAIYEVHIGAFTAEGTLDAATQRLPYLRDLGVTMLEILPLAECAGRWNWGYDGVQLFAPYHVYGDYDAFKRFVDRAHRQGLAVILDVVYNHLGPDGNYLKCFSPHYFSRRHETEWGAALNFDAEHCQGARDFVLANARHWIDEFHVDGFRLDATQSIFDSSQPHILAELVSSARAAAQPRNIVVIAENEPQRSEHLLPPERGGFGLDGMWNDDFHHTARVALTGSRDGYFYDYTGSAREFVAAAKRGFLYQGQHYEWQNKPRGSPLRDQPAWSCINFLQNHDQVANTYVGERLHTLTNPAQYRAVTAYLLLAPPTPLLFMGQEFLAGTRFTFFADLKEELREVVHEGRRDFLKQFQAYTDPTVQAAIKDPSLESTFLESKLDWRASDGHSAGLRLHRELLQLRLRDPVISRQDLASFDGATLSERAFALRWFDETHGDRLLIVNLDHELLLQPAPEPLLAPPSAKRWSLSWSSEDPRYGGHGTRHPAAAGHGPWRIAAHCASLLLPAE
jgi:maltooligosyltrehalose trehalohydrolase